MRKQKRVNDCVVMRLYGNCFPEDFSGECDIFPMFHQDFQSLETGQSEQSSRLGCICDSRNVLVNIFTEHVMGFIIWILIHSYSVKWSNSTSLPPGSTSFPISVKHYSAFGPNLYFDFFIWDITHSTCLLCLALRLFHLTWYRLLWFVLVHVVSFILLYDWIILYIIYIYIYHICLSFFYLFLLFENLTSCVPIALTSQSSYVHPLPVTFPCPKNKFILCCSYIHRGMVKFLMASPPREDVSFSACICPRSHQVRSSVQWPEPSRVSPSAPRHHLHHRTVGCWGVGLPPKCSRHSTGGVVGGGQFSREGWDQLSCEGLGWLSPKGWGQLSCKRVVPPLLCPQHHWHYQHPCTQGAAVHIHFLYPLIGWLLGWFCILTIVKKP